MKTFGHGGHVTNQVWMEMGSDKLHHHPVSIYGSKIRLYLGRAFPFLEMALSKIDMAFEFSIKKTIFLKKKYLNVLCQFFAEYVLS